MTKKLDLSASAYEAWAASDEGKALLAGAEAPERAEGADPEPAALETEEAEDEGVVDLAAREEPAAETQEAAPPPAKQKIKLSRKPVVAGEEQPDEYDEDELIALVQKGKDYDRPGGALEQRANREAETRYWQHLVSTGMAQRGPDGRYYPTERWNAFQRGETGTGHGRDPSATAQPTVDPEDAKVDEDLKALKEKASETRSADDWVAYTDRRAEVAAERATRKAVKQIEERRATATAEQTAQAEQAQLAQQLTSAVDAVLAEFKDEIQDDDAREVHRAVGFRLALAAKKSAPGLTPDVHIATGASQLREKLKKLYEPVKTARAVIDRARAAGTTPEKPRPRAAPNIQGTRRDGPGPRPKFDPKDPFKDRRAWEAREAASAGRS